jgi:hypothetical protein
LLPYIVWESTPFNVMGHLQILRESLKALLYIINIK